MIVCAYKLVCVPASSCVCARACVCACKFVYMCVPASSCACVHACMRTYIYKRMPPHACRRSGTIHRNLVSPSTTWV